MRDEAKILLKAIVALNGAHVGDSDDAEIDAALEIEDAAIALLNRLAEIDPEIAQLLDQFDELIAQNTARS